ncbi:MAG: MotA/TolQ/ExbB proton channel family protein [Flavobacteriales bacterium]|nr:MotA/TolQ/ExbB proton channel family protein [Flavobacteriales bacterium]
MHLPLLQFGTDSARQVLDALNNQPAAPPNALSVWQLIQYGGWYIMGPLALMSLFTIYILIERIMAMRAALKLDNDFMAKVRDYVHDNKIDSAKNLCSNSRSPIAHVVGKGVSRFGSPMEDIESAMQNAAEVEMSKLERNVGTLSLFSKLAPMMGFIGTIIGVINIFYRISLTDNMSIGGIAEGLYQKLVTSGAGLIVGIVAFTAYHILNGMADRVAQRMSQTGMEFMDMLHEPPKS